MTSENENEQKPSKPDIKNHWLLRGIAFVTAVIVALTALVLAANQLYIAIKQSEIPFPQLQNIPRPNIPPQKAKDIPSFPRYDSPSVGGGHVAEEFCEPQKQAYAAQYPNYNIRYIVLPATVTFDLFRRATYIFHCQFVADPK